VLVDKLEQMDPQTMREFGEWLEAEGLQVIATRVTGSGEDCTILIEDGAVAERMAEVARATRTSSVSALSAEPPSPKGKALGETEQAGPSFEMGVF
jgi:hypothetical protein